jgi:hypothetical protein
MVKLMTNQKTQLKPTPSLKNWARVDHIETMTVK